MNNVYSSTVAARARSRPRSRAWLEGAGRRVALALATATAAGAPSVRMVLLKGVDERGLVFYTGYESRKGRELAENPRAALLFTGIRSGARSGSRAGREGSADESEAYWADAAPWGPDRRVGVEAERADRLARRSRGALRRARAGVRGPDEVPWPPHWGGYRLVPEV